jgi:4-amino-4-deoxy-L-arabinose transferase-like glycosyltransferase
MVSQSSGAGGRNWKLPALAAVWLAILCAAYFSVEIPNVPGSARWDIWPLVPDLIDPPRQPTDVGHSGWRYFPQRLDLIAVAAIILGGAWGAGNLLLRVLRPNVPAGTAEHTAFAFGLGLTALSLITLAAGLAGFLSRFLLGGIIFAAFAGEIACRLRTLAWAKAAPVGSSAGAVRNRRSRRLGTWALTLLAFGPFLLVMFLGSLLPSTDFDVNEYHFGGPKEFFQAGRISFLEHNVYTSFPFATEMLTLLAMVLRDDWYLGALAGKCVLMGFEPLTALALYAAGRRWFNPAGGWFAAFLYLATPWVYRIATIAYAEGGVCFFLFASLLAVMLALETGNRGEPYGNASRTWLLAGLLAGAAISCKYPALVSVVAPMGAVACAAAWQQWPGNRRPWNIPMVFALGLVLTFGPWLLKNLVETGNPVYPLAYHLFGGRDWDAALNAKWTAAHSPPGFSWASLWGLACEVAFKSDWISPLLVGMAPAAFLFADSRQARRRAKWVAVYVVWLFISCWLFTHRIDRFWVPMLPAVALLSGIGAAWWWSTFPQVWSRAIMVASLAAIATFQLELMTNGWSGYNGYLRDLDEAGQFAAKKTAPEIVDLNQNLPAGAKVLAVGDAEMFYARFPVVYNTVFDRSILEQWMGDESSDPQGETRLKSASEVQARLKREGITHIYVNWLEILRYRSPGNYGYTDFVRPELFVELQEMGILDQAWRTADPMPDRNQIDKSWAAEMETWGRALIVEHGNLSTFVTYEVFPVNRN